MKRTVLTLCLLCLSFKIFAWHWRDLWSTRDQQAAQYLKQQAYKEAQQTFTQPDWQATAAYRAKDFEAASTTFSQLNSADGYYNQGNAKAQLGQYQEALQAYQKSLVIRPHDVDTLHNKKIIEELLKQQQNKDSNPSQDKQSSENQDESAQKESSQQNKEEPTQGESSKKNKDKSAQEQSSQQNKEEHPSDESSQQNKDEPSQPQSSKQNKDTSAEEQPSQQNKNESAQTPPSQQKKDEPAEAQSSNNATPSNAENYQATEQWLNMIPDDPGGLLRQKFLRDHRRRANGDD